MGQVDTPSGNAPKTKVTLTQEVWELAKQFVNRKNDRDPIAKVSLQAVVNQAVREYVASHTKSDDEEQQAA